jgi:hypothetical protein
VRDPKYDPDAIDAENLSGRTILQRAAFDRLAEEELLKILNTPPPGPREEPEQP